MQEEINLKTRNFSLVPMHKVPGACIIKCNTFVDARGTFEESYSKYQFEQLGLPTEWPQDNVSCSTQRGVLRGLHIQTKNPQGKLIRCIVGEIDDFCVDLRHGPTFGHWVKVNLNAASSEMFFLPPGTAHGFVVKSANAVVQYKCTTSYEKDHDTGILWCDKQLGIDWGMPDCDFIISEKDQRLPTLAEYMGRIDNG